MNDVIMMLHEKFPQAMTEFCTSFGIRAEGMCGGQYNGPNCRRVLEFVDQLDLYLGEGGEDFITYLRSVKELYQVCVSKILVPNFQEVIERWKMAFDQMHNLHHLSMTVKAHNFYHHLETFFSHTGQSLHFASAEGIEASHSKYKTVGCLGHLFQLQEGVDGVNHDQDQLDLRVSQPVLVEDIVDVSNLTAGLSVGAAGLVCQLLTTSIFHLLTSILQFQVARHKTNN